MWDSLVTKQRRKTSLLCGEGIRQATHTLQFLPRYCFLALVVFSRNVCRYQRDKYRYFLSKHLSCTTLCHLFLVSTSCRIDGTSEYRRCSCKMYFNMRVWLHLVPAESRSFFIYIPGLRPYSPSITHRCVCVCKRMKELRNFNKLVASCIWKQNMELVLPLLQLQRCSNSNITLLFYSFHWHPVKQYVLKPH